MRSPTNLTLDEVVSRWEEEPIVYICDALGGMNEIIYCLDVKKRDKDVLLKLLNNIQNKANKMEDAIIIKNCLLKSEGYEKCSHCGSFGKPVRDYDGLYYSCCGMSH